MYFSVNKRFIILFAWLILIMVLLLSTMPLVSGQGEATYFDKIVHALLFGIFAFLIFFRLKGINDEMPILNPEKNIKNITIDKKRKRKYLKINQLLSMFLITFFASTSFSSVLEYAQAYVPGREVNHNVLLASVIGIILVLAFIYGDNFSKK